MSKLELNGLLVNRMTGRHGDVVVRSLRGRTFTTRVPKRSSAPLSEGQRFVHNRFKLANAYAQGALRNPEKRLVYEQAAKSRHTSPFGQAMGDFLRSPEITLVDVAEYHGQIGDTLTILATDDTGVVAVSVVIRSATSAILEQGSAMLVDGIWKYTGTTALPVGQAVTIEVTAKDRPGNAAVTQTPFTS